MSVAQGKHVMLGRIDVTFDVISEQVQGNYCALRQVVPPGHLYWPHIHQNEDQVVVVLEGTLGFRVGDKEWLAATGEVVHLPRGIAHTMWNASDTTTVMLEISTPGAFESYISGLAQMINSGDMSGRQALLDRFGISGQEGWADEIAQKYGVAL